VKVLIALGIVALIGFAVMVLNFIERPDNDSGNPGSGFFGLPKN